MSMTSIKPVITNKTYNQKSYNYKDIENKMSDIIQYFSELADKLTEQKILILLPIVEAIQKELNNGSLSGEKITDLKTKLQGLSRSEAEELIDKLIQASTHEPCINFYNKNTKMDWLGNINFTPTIKTIMKNLNATLERRLQNLRIFLKEPNINMTAEQIIEACKNPSNFKYGDTTLHTAINIHFPFPPRTHVIKFLIAVTTDINKENEFGDTALALAIKSWDTESALELLKAGADPFLQSKNRNGDYYIARGNPNGYIRLENRYSYTPFMLTLIEGPDRCFMLKPVSCNLKVFKTILQSMTIDYIKQAKENIDRLSMEILSNIINQTLKTIEDAKENQEKIKFEIETERFNHTAHTEKAKTLTTISVPSLQELLIREAINQNIDIVSLPRNLSLLHLANMQINNRNDALFFNKTLNNHEYDKRKLPL